MPRILRHPAFHAAILGAILFFLATSSLFEPRAKGPAIGAAPPIPVPASVAAPNPPPPPSASPPKTPAHPEDGDHTSEPAVLDSFGTSHKPACGEGWYTNNLAQAEEQARQTGKILLLIFEKIDCPHCRHFNDIMLADPEMAEIVRSPKFVVCKRFYDEWDQRNYNIKFTPTFVAFRVTPEGRTMIEYLPGLLELPLMKKRLRDASENRGRLDELRKALTADANDQDSLKTLLDEYGDIFPPGEKVQLLQRALQLDPTWTHGDALYIWTLQNLIQQKVASAKTTLETYVGEAQARLTKEVGTARDHFIVGYYQMTANDHAAGVRNLEQSLELVPTDAEVYCHLAFGHAMLAAKAFNGGDKENARTLLLKAEDDVRKALTFDPNSALARIRKKWIDEQWGVLGLRKD